MTDEAPVSSAPSKARDFLHTDTRTVAFIASSGKNCPVDLKNSELILLEGKKCT